MALQYGHTEPSQTDSANQNGIPPSTLAAQILQTRSAAVIHQENGHKEQFEKLLMDFLNDPVIDAGKGKVQENARFVSFLVEAALESRSKNNPFAPECLNQQAIDCLKAVRLTIERHPEILLSSGDESEPDLSPPPMLLWLIEKILCISASQQLGDGWDRLGDVLAGCHISLSTKPATWRIAVSTLQLFGSMVQNLLDAVESYAGTTNDPTSAFTVVLPSSESIVDIWQPAEHSVALPPGFQLSLKRPNDAINVCLVLFSAIVQCAAPRSTRALVQETPEMLVWFVDCSHHLLDCHSRLEDSQQCLDRKQIVSYLSTASQTLLHAHPKLSSSRNFVRLVARILQFIAPQDGEEAQRQLSKSLFFLLKRGKDSGACNIIHDGHFIRVLIEVFEKSAQFLQFHTSLQSAVRLCLKFARPDLTLPTDTNSGLVELETDLHVPESDLFATLLALSLTPKRMLDDDQVDLEPPGKRQRLDDDQEGYRPHYNTLVMKLTEILSGQQQPTLHILQDEDIESFVTLTDEEKSSVVGILKSIPCAGSGCLGFVPRTAEVAFRCEICDSSSIKQLAKTGQYWNDHSPRREYASFFALLSRLIEASAVRHSKILRIQFAQVIRRLINHTSDWDFLDMTSADLGRWCMRSFQSSLRELRISALLALMPYLRESLPKDIRHRNRSAFLELLKTLATRENLAQQETLILAWGLIGLECGETELNIALLELVKALGHTHMMICGVAFNELRRLASHLDIKPVELFRPFWRSVAPDVVKDLTTCPQKAQQLSDLLGLNGGVDELLVLTQAETVPFLVLTKRHDILQRIAQARKSTQLQELIMDPPRNLAGVLSRLLLESGDTEHAAASLLQDAAPNLRNRFVEVVKIDPILTACEMLKAAGDSDERARLRAHEAFKLLARIAERKSDSSRSNVKQPHALSTFLDAHILGIMSHFTDIIDSSTERQPINEKRRALKAVEQLVALAEDQVELALPQFRATLQSAFQATELVDDAFSAWTALLNVVDPESIQTLIHHTFSIIKQNWYTFDTSTQTRASEVVKGLIEKHNASIVAHVDMLPSLGGIDLLQKFESEIQAHKTRLELSVQLQAFAKRCKDENATVVRQALQELEPFLDKCQTVLQESASGHNPMPIIGQLCRSLLDASIRFKENYGEIIDLCAKCLGIIGCIDSNRVETVREKHGILVLSNFDSLPEVVEFVAHMLETVIVDAFRSAPTGKAQSYLAYVMQELLKFSGITEAVTKRAKASPPKVAYARWQKIPESIQSTLTPYLNSKYRLTNPIIPTDLLGFPNDVDAPAHASWIRTLVFTLLHRGKGHNAQAIFPVISRVIPGHDLAIATFMLPFVIQNVVVGGTVDEIDFIKKELNSVLIHPIENLPASEAENIKQCSENVFQVLDYLSRWLQEKNKLIALYANRNSRTLVNLPPDFDLNQEVLQVSRVEEILAAIPALKIAHRAVECSSYARAVFHWEQHMRHIGLDKVDTQYKDLQAIYEQINEPDAIEGISTHLHVLDLSQQVMDHKRAGRWTTALSYYELALQKNQEDPQAQAGLLSCLKSAGQYDALLNSVGSLLVAAPDSINTALPFAAEASWITGKWDFLQRLIEMRPTTDSQDFNVGVGKAFLAIRRNDPDEFNGIVFHLRTSVSQGLSPSSTSSLSNAHTQLVRLHALYELEMLSPFAKKPPHDRNIPMILNCRLDILGSLTDDKQYILGIRRAALDLASPILDREETEAACASAWLTTSRLARKANQINIAYDAVLRATVLNDEAATIEHSRLLWKDGHHRKAIQNLQGAIATNTFASTGHQATLIDSLTESTTSARRNGETSQNVLLAKTQLLLAKWIDFAGQGTSKEILQHYKNAADTHRRWDKGHYYLGSYYNKVLDSEKAAPAAMQTESYLTGECDKLVIENYLRSMIFGPKYLYRTVPKVFTLWLDFGQDLAAKLKTSAQKQQLDRRRTASRQTQPEFPHLEARTKILDRINAQMEKYMVKRLPAYIPYTAFAQMLSRIDSPHSGVLRLLTTMILNITSKYPRQALWSVLAVSRSKIPDKKARAVMVMQSVMMSKKQHAIDLKTLLHSGEDLTNALLEVCKEPIDSRGFASLTRDLRFKRDLMAPCGLVVPLQQTLTASLSTTIGAAPMKDNRPFPRNPITIAGFQDEVLVLSSLQKPRKLIVIGSDGQKYPLLCKPKDDLRKDQRLMEFNAMIDRALKRDVEASKRKLYIKTYAVTPLNDQHGVLEWVDNLKPLRDIIVALYSKQGVKVNFNEIRMLLDSACSNPDTAHTIFTDKILSAYPPVLYKWFIETFPSPDAWYAARLTYSRSCAVTSIVGHALGLGDRHGENISLETRSGGVFHVDFNCLFEKGLTFDKPEMVPFRLTHNMVDAFGVYGTEGPFRIAAEITQRTLRQYEDTLMTIMETFLYDPTTDFGLENRRRVPGVPETPEEVLEGVKAKFDCLLRGETVPLSVEGYVDTLIRMAVDPKNLVRMYVGWCAYL